ncbi:MAG: hypothetical protein QM487_03005 [Candidatus Marithrix sp.]
MKNVILNLILFCNVCFMLWIPVLVEAGTIQRVDVNNNGEKVKFGSKDPFISNNGRYIVFQSRASNLIENDNKGWDIFVYDLLQHQIELVSVDNDGKQIGGEFHPPSISADGRYVVFAKKSFYNNNLFIHDRETSITKIVDSYTHKYPLISSNGKYIVSFSSNDLVECDSGSEIYLQNLDSYTTTFIGCGTYSFLSISGDGKFIAFTSFNKGRSIVSVYDRTKNNITEVSVDSNGNKANKSSRLPKISTNGRYVVFESDATNLVENDTNEQTDIFLHDLETGITSRVNVDNDGNQSKKGGSTPSISGDGRYVAFNSGDNLDNGIPSNNRSKIFVHDMQTGENINLPSRDYFIDSPVSFNTDGQYIAFFTQVGSPWTSYHDGHIYLYDMGAGSIITISGKVNSPDNQPQANISLCIDNNCEANTDSTGNFTLTREFRNGLYLITPQTSEPLKFTPKSQWLNITDQPIENINFIATPYDPNPHIYVSTNATQFSAKRPTIDVNIRMDFAGDEPIEKNYDVYVAVGTVGASIESMLFHNKQTGFQTTLTPYATNQRITPTDDEWQTIFTYFFDKQVPPGDYFIHVGLMDTDNGELVAEDRVEVNYNPDPKTYYYPGMIGGVARIPTPKSELPSNPEHTVTTELETYLLDGDDSEEAIAKLGADATLDLMIATLDHRGLKMFKRATGILNDISGAGIAYIDFSADVSNGQINTNQRDMLFGVYILGSLLEKASLYSVDPKDLADSIKRIFVASNEHKRTLASVAAAGGVSFPTKFIFDHLGFFSFMADEHELKVKLQALIIYDDDLETPKKIMSKNNLKDMYVCQFNVQSKGVKIGVMLPDPGLYLITAEDQTTYEVRQQTIIIDGADVSVQFDYGEYGTGTWDYENNEVQKCSY